MACLDDAPQDVHTAIEGQEPGKEVKLDVSHVYPHGDDTEKCMENTSYHMRRLGRPVVRWFLLDGDIR